MFDITIRRAQGTPGTIDCGSQQVDQADEGGRSQGDDEQRTPAAQQVDGDRHGESEDGVNRRSWKADNTSPERGHGQDAQNANGHPSGECFDQGRLSVRWL